MWIGKTLSHPAILFKTIIISNNIPDKFEFILFNKRMTLTIFNSASRFFDTQLRIESNKVIVCERFRAVIDNDQDNFIIEHLRLLQNYCELTIEEKEHWNRLENVIKVNYR